jgi:hypothetical protein
MKQIIGLIFLAVFFTGCTAEMMETRGDKIILIHPPNEKPGKGGVIRYLNGGMTSWRNVRRANAEKQMEHFCGGPYTITAEGPRSKFGADMPIGKSVSFEVDQYTYIAFDCAKQ